MTATTWLRCVVVASATIPFVTGCGTGTVTDPTGTTVSGTWTGRANGIEPADFTLVLSQSGTTVTGTGNIFFPGDGQRYLFDVTGSTTGSGFTVTLQLRPPPQRPSISYAGSWDAKGMTGRLNGGDLQHDGPFADTPLSLTKQG
jgi:hypothetical protein